MRVAKCMCVLLALALLVAGRAAAAAVSCSDAVNALIPCGSFLIGVGEADPSKECCASAQSLNKMATTVESRRALCECLKQTGPSFGVKPERARRLPPFCKLKLNIPVSPNVNCTGYVAIIYSLSLSLSLFRSLSPSQI